MDLSSVPEKLPVTTQCVCSEGDRSTEGAGPSRETRIASGDAYTIEKGGQKKLIYQAPWYVDGEYRGLVELALPLPDTLPHFVRDSA